ncbi:hypothetical protein B0H13DRAFT_1899643 [Mycena leptocephala]|nr:hypothetical protein B0H13DRAFT_1899643 [Mycena leptocephala]
MDSTSFLELIPVHILSQKRQGTSQPRFIGFEAHLAYCNADSRSVPSTQKYAEFRKFTVFGWISPSYELYTYRRLDSGLNEPQFTHSTNYSFIFMNNQSTPDDDSLELPLQDYLRIVIIKLLKAQFFGCMVGVSDSDFVIHVYHSTYRRRTTSRVFNYTTLQANLSRFSAAHNEEQDVPSKFLSSRSSWCLVYLSTSTRWVHVDNHNQTNYASNSMRDTSREGVEQSNQRLYFAPTPRGTRQVARTGKDIRGEGKAMRQARPPRNFGGGGSGLNAKHSARMLWPASVRFRRATMVTGGRADTVPNARGKTAREDTTHWVNEHHCPDSALVRSAKTSETTGASEEADAMMAGAGVANGVMVGVGGAGGHSGRSEHSDGEVGGVGGEQRIDDVVEEELRPVMTYDVTSARHYSAVLATPALYRPSFITISMSRMPDKSSSELRRFLHPSNKVPRH